MKVRTAGVIVAVAMTSLVPSGTASAQTSARARAATAPAWVSLPSGERVETVAGRPVRVDGGTGHVEYKARGDWYVIPRGARTASNVSALARGESGTAPAREARAAAEEFTLTLVATDRRGRPADVQGVYVFDLATGEAVDLGKATYRLPRGRYAVLSILETPRVGQLPAITYYDVPEIRLDNDTTVALDARTATRINVKAPAAAATGGVFSILQQIKTPGKEYPDGLRSTADPRFQELYAGSAPGADLDNYRFTVWLRAEEPKVDLRVLSPAQFPVQASTWNPDRPGVNLTLPVIDGGHGSAEEIGRIDPRDRMVMVDAPASEEEAAEFYKIEERIAAAGGKAVLIEPWHPTGVREAAAGRTLAAESVVIPTVSSSGPSGQRLADAVTRGDGVTVKVVTRQAPKQRFELVRSYAGAIPKTIDYRPTIAELAAVDAKYYGGGVTPFNTSATVDLDGWRLSGEEPGTVMPASKRVEYVTPGTWHLRVQPGWGSEDLLAPVRTLTAGSRSAYEWNKPVYTPSFAGETEDWWGGSGAMRPLAVLRPGTLIVDLPLYTDAAGNLRTPITSQDEGSAVLYRNGELAGQSDSMVGWTEFSVVPDPEPADYRLEITNARTDPEWPLATKSSVTWEFSAGAETGQTVALPLLAVRYSPKLDLRGTAPGGRAFVLPVTVERQPAAGTSKVASVTVDASYDDGVTWQPATMSSVGGVWTAMVKHAGSGFVSLRAKAADTDGNRVEQTVIRAYALR